MNEPPQPRLHKDQEEIVRKFGELIRQAATLHDITLPATTAQLVLLREVRASALNLLARVASPSSIYYRELAEAGFTDHLALRGVLQAAMNDYRQGYIANNLLLISAEVFSDLLVQAEVLLEFDYKDASAVIVRAVLEDGLRRLCQAHGLPIEPRDTIGPLNDKLYRAKVYSVLQHKEIVAKAQIGNDAAHGKWNQYTKDDVASFLAYVRRFLADALR